MLLILHGFWHLGLTSILGLIGCPTYYPYERQQCSPTKNYNLYATIQSSRLSPSLHSMNSVQTLLATDRILAREKVTTNLEKVLSMLLQAFNKPLLHTQIQCKRTL